MSITDTHVDRPSIDVRKRLVADRGRAYKVAMSPAPLDPDRCYQAILARDPRFDGHFFTAVATTGIYCRPVCPARTPRRSSCGFYRTAVAAEHAGFRPCLRCRPELAPGRADFNTSLAESVFAHLQAGALDEGTVETLATDIGLSSRQVRRIVLDHFGVTPIEVAQTHRLLFAKKLLHETGLSMTQLAYASGFRSLRRFNAAFHDRYGLAPSALRRQAGARTTKGGDEEPLAEDIVLRLSYRPPLDWTVLAEYLRFRGTPGVEVVELVEDAPVYRRTVSLPSSAGAIDGWVSVSCPSGRSAIARRSSANVLRVAMSSALLPVLMNATQRLRVLFDLDADPLRIAAHLGSDPLLAGIDGLSGLRVPGAWDAFELALRAVLGQQVSVAGASTLSGRLARRFGRAITTPFAGLDRGAVAAEALASVELVDIAAVGMPKSRANTVRELARFAASGGLRMAPGTSCEEAVTRLDAIPGIGPWTANYIAMRALRHPDAFPAADLGLRKALGVLERAPSVPTEAALASRAEAWRPWRAYAAIALWHSLTPPLPSTEQARRGRST